MITLLPHQLEAIDWLHAHHGIGLLYISVGRGKTFASLGYIQKHTTGSILIICPASLIQQWRDETNRFDPILSSRITIINYEKLLNDALLRNLIKTHWDTIILDECQAINNPSAKKTKRLKKLNATHRIALSGTPFLNALWECWSLMDWLQPQLLGKSFYWFKQNCLKLHPAFHGIVGFLPGIEEKLRKTIAPLIFRIEADPTALPPKHEHYTWVELSPAHRKLYNELEETLRLEVEGKDKITVTNVISLIMRLRQLTDMPSIFSGEDRGAKAEALSQLIHESAEKAIVFSEFASVATMLNEFDNYGCMFTGATPVAMRNDVIEQFKTDPRTLRLYTTAAGSTGLNLQCATHVYHMGVPWNDGRREQRTARSYRTGQTQETHEHYILAKDTVDEKMFKLLQKKKGLAQTFNKTELLSLLR